LPSVEDVPLPPPFMDLSRPGVGGVSFLLQRDERDGRRSNANAHDKVEPRRPPHTSRLRAVGGAPVTESGSGTSSSVCQPTDTAELRSAESVTLCLFGSA
jgi:hypothetical protein